MIKYRGNNTMYDDVEKNRAEVLIEALPYIRYFHEKIIVVKYGGSVMDSESLSNKLIEDIALLKSVGFRPVIVHGGGKEISKWVKMSGHEVKFINGFRYTDKTTIDIAQMVLNKINKDLVRRLSKLGVKAIGISGQDGKMLHVKKKEMADGKDLGFVGQIDHVDSEIIKNILDRDYVPIICPIGYDDEYLPYNINADDAAYSVATSLKAAKLAFLTDVEGLYSDFNDKSTLISEIRIDDAKALLQSGDIKGGMIPKLTNCISAIEKGVSRVHILDGRIPHSLLLEIFTNKGVGTAIIGNNEEKFMKD